jgi:hypothetical protein
VATARLRREAKELARQLREALSPRREADPHAFAGRPVEYAEEVLGITTLTGPQQRILRAIHEPPCRVLVPSGHDLGKTFVAAVLACYWYDSFDPGLVLTTAPTERDVIDLLWTEIRLLRQRAGLPLGDLAPSAPYMGTSPDHYAKGYVSRKGQAFQGRHRQRMLFIFDEGNDVQPIHWITPRTMADPTLGCAWLAIFNPTSTTSAAYQEDMMRDRADGAARWTRIRLSAFDHPNIAEELAGRPKPIRGAVSLAMLDEWVRDWCEPVADPADRKATDIEWPPGSGRWHRPGVVFQARALGVWPDHGDGVWSPALWEACLRGPRPPQPLSRLPEIGIDCSLGRGEDYFALHCRWGAVSLFHKTSNTMDAVRIAGRAREACRRAAEYVIRARPAGAEPVRPHVIRIKVDDDGTGNAVAALLKREGYSVALVSAATSALHPDLYPRMRDEAWFLAAEKARRGLVSLGRLDRPTQARLRQQLLAPAWDMDSAGRRTVERKDQTKDKIGRNPDDADALNLAYLECGVAPESRGVVPDRLDVPMTKFAEEKPPRPQLDEGSYAPHYEALFGGGRQPQRAWEPPPPEHRERRLYGLQ